MLKNDRRLIVVDATAYTTVMDRESARKMAYSMGSACLGLRVRLLMREVTRVYEEALRPLGVTLPQLNLLAAIAWLEPTTSAKLCDRIKLDPSTASRAIPLMREHGWVAAGSTVKLTVKGRRLLERVWEPWERAQTEVVGLLGEADAAELTEITERLWTRVTGGRIAEGGLERWRQA